LKFAAMAKDRDGGQLWEVVGGTESNGIVVRAGEGLSTPIREARLATGAVVRQVALAKERLHYKLFSGEGPQDGWVSLRVKGKELLVPTTRQLEPSSSSAPARGSGGGATTAEATPRQRPQPLAGQRSALRVLCLHGGGSNSRIMEYQTMGMRRALGAKAEWHFLDGGREWSTTAPVNEMMLALAKGEPMRGWYQVSDDGDPKKTNEEKLFDMSVTYTYGEVEDGVDRVLAYIKEHGPFDVLMGFSQGCVITHLVAAMLRERGEAIAWRLSVLFCGMRVRDNRYLEQFAKPLALPCVQIYGKEDPYYTYGRESQPQMYLDPVILEHDEGHKFPTPGKGCGREIYDRVTQEMLWHCGMSELDPALRR